MKILDRVNLISGLCLVLACSTALQAANEFEQDLVPRELAEYLNGGAIYSSLPDNFPIVPLPANIGLSVVGSIDRGFTQQVLLRNMRSGAAVREDLVAAYSAAGWIDLSQQSGYSHLCHDQLGSLQIQYFDASGGDNRVQVSRSNFASSVNPGYPSCAQQLDQIIDADQSTSSVLAFFALMPLLAVPDQSTTPPASFMPSIRTSFSTGNGTEVSRDGTIEVPDMTTAELHEHFAAQMEAQGWHADSEDAGTFSASSVWYKTGQLASGDQGASEDVPLTGIMTILNSEDFIYRVLFKMQTDAITFLSSERPPMNVPMLGIRGVPIGLNGSVRDFLPYYPGAGSTFLPVVP